MGLSERLASLRGAVPGLTSSELDRLCGLRKGHTRAIETSPDANPTLETLQKIATTFGVPVGYVANGEGPEPFRPDVHRAVELAREAHKKPGKKPEATAEPEATFHNPPAPTGTDS